jgi:hypothetical protein
MGFTLSAGADRRQAVQALIGFAFQELGCVHLEIMDRNLTVSDLGGLGVQHRVYRGFEIDLTRDEDELFSNMTSACRRCVRKAEKEGVLIEEAHNLEFADEYYAQLKDVFAKKSLVPTYGIERVRQLITCHPRGSFCYFGPAIQVVMYRHGIFPMNGVMYFWGGQAGSIINCVQRGDSLERHEVGKKRVFKPDKGGGEYKRNTRE